MAGTYKRKKVKENPERQIVLGLIVSDEYFKMVQPLLQSELIETPYIKTVIKWAIKYWEQFQKAPGIHIEDIFKKEAKAGNIDEDEESLIKELLLSLSDDYERAAEFNVQYLLDQTESYLETKNLELKTKKVKVLLERGELSSAQNELIDYKRISISKSKAVDPFTNREEMAKAFDYAAEPLFKLPGAAGRFLNDMFTRDSFVTLLGPEKRGKTWMLIELSIWARRAGRNVAFFCAGDMTLPQMLVRYGVRFAGKSHRKKYCGELKVPCLDCMKNQLDDCDDHNRLSYSGVIKDKEKMTFLEFEAAPDYIPCDYCRRSRRKRDLYEGSSWYRTKAPVSPLEWTEAVKYGERYQRRWGKKSRLFIEAYSNGTLSVAEIERKLDIWEMETGFVPDIIICDYMDIMVGEKSDQFRHQENSKWAAYRGLTQKRHCLGLSASQSDSASYYAPWISMKNFSEDKRKFSHVTGTITLNQLPEEKKRGIMRLGQLAVREDEFNENQSVTILQSLAMGRPLLASF